jgi:hypothetical protein
MCINTNITVAPHAQYDMASSVLYHDEEKPVVYGNLLTGLNFIWPKECAFYQLKN